MRIAKWIEQITLGSIAVIAVTISVLDLTGALDGEMWLAHRIPTITLLVVGACITQLAVSRATSRGDFDEALARSQASSAESMETAANLIINSLDGVGFRAFASVTSYWNYVATQVSNSNESVDALPWGPDNYLAGTADEGSSYTVYRTALAKAAERSRSSPERYVREIMSFPPGTPRLTRAEALLKERYPNYSLRYFDFDHEGVPPLFQFIIVDRLEVMMHVQPGSTGARDASYIAVRSPKLASFMTQLFEKCWREGLVLKDVQGVRAETVAKLKERLKQ